MSLSPTSAIPRLLVAAMLLLTVASCSGSPFPLPTKPVENESPAPSASTPQEALRLLEWSWEQRDSARYAELIADDFQFVFSALDPYGNPYRDNPWTRTDDVISAGNLFHGGDANQPLAASIQMQLDRNFVVGDDPRFPGQGTWRKQIRTFMTLTLVDANQSVIHVFGYAFFSLARGDVAVIPEELLELGIQPDSTRWYLERWEDVPIYEGTYRALPSKSATVGSLKARYR